MEIYFILAHGFAEHIQRENLEAGTIIKKLEEEYENIVGTIPDKDNTTRYEITTVSLTELQYEHGMLLLAIPKPFVNRLSVFQNRQWMIEGISLDEGDLVTIINHSALPTGAAGYLRYKGPLSEKLGTWFGVELLPSYAGEGTSDGEFRKERLFTCAEDCAVFVNIYNIRKYIHAVRSRRSPSPPLEDFTYENSRQFDSALCNLIIDERVVWFSDEGSKDGTVRWIGVLPESIDKKIVIGVEFDEPVGSGTGRYKGHQLFQTPRGHASLMPPEGLIKASDFYGATSALSLRSNMGDLDLKEITSSNSLDRDSGRGRSSSGKSFSSSSTSYALTTHDRPGQYTAMNTGSSFAMRGEQTYLGNSSASLPTQPRFKARGDFSFATPSPSQNTLPYRFDIGSHVYIEIMRERRYGTIKYIGDHPKKVGQKIVGLEMESGGNESIYTYGEFNGQRMFESPDKKAFFVYLEKCKPDDRFQ